MTLENLSSGFLTMYDSNQTAQPQTLVRRLKFYMKQFDYHTFQIANNKVADQTVQMGRLVCTFVVHIQQNQISLMK